jgi:hypothetical protein
LLWVGHDTHNCMRFIAVFPGHMTRSGKTAPNHDRVQSEKIKVSHTVVSAGHLVVLSCSSRHVTSNTSSGPWQSAANDLEGTTCPCAYGPGLKLIRSNIRPVPHTQDLQMDEVTAQEQHDILSQILPKLSSYSVTHLKPFSYSTVPLE